MFKYLSVLLLTVIVFYGCDSGEDTAKTEEEFTLVSKRTINVKEPSDLALSYDKKSLWTVSDSTGSIYRLSLNGDVEKELAIGGNDPEGIAVISSQVLAVVFEKKNHIVFYDTSGNKLKTVNIDLGSEIKPGLEGIAYSSNIGHYFLINEKNPSAIIELDESFNIINTTEPKLTTDLSGICYEENENIFWVISDESKFLGRFDKSFKLLKSYTTPLAQGEGVAVDYSNKLIYMVSDKDNSFYVYKWK
jgi:uncharacterized protein YjiK